MSKMMAFFIGFGYNEANLLIVRELNEVDQNGENVIKNTPKRNSLFYGTLN